MIRKCNFAGVASSLKYLQGNYRLRGNAEGFEVGKEKIRAARGSVLFVCPSWQNLESLWGKMPPSAKTPGSGHPCLAAEERTAVSQVMASFRGHRTSPQERLLAPNA